MKRKQLKKELSEKEKLKQDKSENETSEKRQF